MKDVEAKMDKVRFFVQEKVCLLIDYFEEIKEKFDQHLPINLKNGQSDNQMSMRNTQSGNTYNNSHIEMNQKKDAEKKKEMESSLLGDTLAYKSIDAVINSSDIPLFTSRY